MPGAWLVWMTIAAEAALPTGVADAVAMNDCATVLTALPAPKADDERLAAGICLQRTGKHADAAAVLAPVGTGVYGDYARTFRAQALADAGKPKEALDVLQGLTLPGPTGVRLRLLRDRLLVESDRSLEARDDLRALLDGDEADEARYWLALGAEKRGDRDAAVTTYRRTWADSVLGPWSGLAAERLAALDAPVPDYLTGEGRALVRERIAALRKANQHDVALDLLLKLKEADPAAAGPLELARARFDGRDYPGARDAYRAVLGEPASATGGAKDLFEYALTTARAGDYDTAAVIYRRCAAQHPDTKDADFASFKIGYMEYDRANLAKAREELAAHIARRPDSAHLDEAYWFSARAAWRLKDYAAAEKDLDALLAKRSKSSLAPGALYWKARSRGVQGDPAAEGQALERLIASYPTSGHAWFAASRLGRTFPKQAIVPRPAWPASFASRDDVRRAEALLAVGLKREARAELSTAADAASASGRDVALAAAHALIAAGDYNRGKKLASAHCTSPWKGGDPVAQQACTPMPEATIVFDTAGRYGLDPLVPFGIMTAESALQPEVTSIAGARGLMQLMPVEAERIHVERFGSTPFDPDALYSAPYNAAMGTTELGLKTRSLGTALQGTSVPAVVASYNGGEEAVRRWLTAYEGAPPFDEFAEDVGYTETRQYVRRVLGYVMAYRWVYGDQ